MIRALFTTMTSRTATLFLSIFLLTHVKSSMGSRDLSLKLGRISFHNFLSFNRHRLSSPLRSHSDVQSTDLCDLDTTNWVASSVPMVRISKNKHRQSRKSASSEKSARKHRIRDRHRQTDEMNVADKDSPLREEIDSEVLVGVTSPLMPQSIWDRLTGREFNTPVAVEKLAQTGLYMATAHEGNEWVDWKPSSKDTALAIEQGREDEVMNDGQILVFVGHPKKDGMGSHMPFVKTKSIVHFSAKELAELVLDSSRVQLYNKFSLGRTDVSVMQKGIDSNGPFGVGETKVVQNLAQPPITSKKMLSVTLMHVRQLPPECQQSGYLVVSRALGGKQIEESSQVVRNYVLLGVNLIEVLDETSCLVTAITHLYSPALPGFLASRFGVKSAVKFARDIRHLSLVRS